MNISSRQAHWQQVYTSKGETEVSWFQEDPAPSLQTIARSGAPRFGDHRYWRRRVAACRCSAR